MEQVVLVIHLILAVSIIVLVLIQRSEGGGLGLGGGSGGLGSFATASSTASTLTRTTGILAACFFATSLTLAVLAGFDKKPSTSILDNLDNPATAVEATIGKTSGENTAADKNSENTEKGTGGQATETGEDLQQEQGRGGAVSSSDSGSSDSGESKGGESEGKSGTETKLENNQKDMKKDTKGESATVTEEIPSAPVSE